MLVVRPTGVYHPHKTNALVWLAPLNRSRGSALSAKVLASKNGPERDANLSPALTTNRIRGAIMADRLNTLREESVQARFWAKVEVRGPDDCWDWQASKNRLGYGRFKYASYRQTGAHRVALILHTDEDPTDLCALHSCDRPSCVNPNHLRWGTVLDNSDDKIARGRFRHMSFPGFANPRCTLTPDQLAEIVHLIDHSRLNNGQIGARYGLTHSMISKIRTGNSWQTEVAAIRARLIGEAA